MTVDVIDSASRNRKKSSVAHIEHNFKPSGFKHVEDILEKLGGFSRFQLWATVIIIITEIPAAMISMSPLFIGGDHIDYECLTSNGTQILTQENFCAMIPSCIEPIQSSGIKLKSILQEWDLYCERAWIIDTITSVQMAGSMVGALLFPLLADRYGRKKILIFILIMMGISGCVAGWANNAIIYAGLRFIAGLGIGGSYVVYLNYLMEFLTPSYRTICGCVTLWALGEMLLGLAGHYLRDWRHLSFATGLPAILITLFLLWIPESPRWLLCQNRTEDALRVFNHIGRWNGKSPLHLEEIQSVQDEIQKESESCPNSSLCSNFQVVKAFKNQTYRAQFIFLMIMWFSMGLIYYGLSFNTKHLAGSPYLNMVYLGISELPGPLSGVLFNNRLGRRLSLIIVMSLGATVLTVLAILQIIPSAYIGDNFDMGTTTIVLALLGRYFIATGYAVMACCTIESFPTAIRGTYAGICGFLANIGGVLAPQLVFLGTVWPIAPYIGFCFLTLLVVGACLGLKETGGKPLNDSLEKPRNIDRLNSIISLRL